MRWSGQSKTYNADSDAAGVHPFSKLTMSRLLDFLISRFPYSPISSPILSRRAVFGFIL